VRQNAPRAECTDSVDDANRVTTTGARSGAPAERHRLGAANHTRELRALAALAIWERGIAQQGFDVGVGA